MGGIPLEPSSASEARITWPVGSRANCDGAVQINLLKNNIVFCYFLIWKSELQCLLLDINIWLYFQCKILNSQTKLYENIKKLNN